MNNRQDVPGKFNFVRAFTACDAGPVAGDACSAPSEGTGSDQTGDAIASLLLGTGSGQSAIQMDPAMSLRSEEHTSELQSRRDLVCRLLLEKKKPHYCPASAIAKTPARG